MKEIYDEYEAAEYCKLDHNYFRNLRKTGHGPTFFRPSPHVALYRLVDLDEWKDAWVIVRPCQSKP